VKHHDSIRVIVVDDDDLMRAGIAAILAEDAGIEVIAQADDGVGAIRMATDLRPDVIVMDMAMPLIDGVRATRHLSETLPDIRVLTLSSATDNRRVREIIDAGAAGYVVKSSARRELAVAVRQVANGMVYLSPSISSTLLQSIVSESPQQSPAGEGS
jgi:DNA-binding NarL/FixJ family response regulator